MFSSGEALVSFGKAKHTNFWTVRPALAEALAKSSGKLVDALCSSGSGLVRLIKLVALARCCGHFFGKCFGKCLEKLWEKLCEKLWVACCSGRHDP